MLSYRQRGLSRAALGAEGTGALQKPTEREHPEGARAALGAHETGALQKPTEREHPEGARAALGAYNHVEL